MINNANWDDVLANEDAYIHIDLICSLNRAGLAQNATVSFTNADLDSSGLIIDNRGFSDYSVGNFSSTMIKFSIVEPDARIYIIQPKTIINLRLSVRRRSDDSTITGFVNAGKFMILSVESTNNNSLVTVTAYDAVNAVLKTQRYISSSPAQQSFSNVFSWGSVSIGGISLTILRALSEDARMNSLLMDASKLRSKNRTWHEVLCAFLAGAGVNAFLHREGSNEYLAIYELQNISSITDEPLGSRATAGSLVYDLSNNSISGLTANVENDVSQTYGGGNTFVVKLLDAAIVDSSTAQTIYNNIGNGGSKRFDNVVASDVEVSPLIENGDVVSIEQSDGTFFNFAISGYRKTIRGGNCWCELLSPNNGTNTTMLTDQGTTGLTEVQYPAFTPTPIYEGDRFFKIERIILTSASTMPLWIRFQNGGIGAFSYTYTSTSGASTTVTSANAVVLSTDYPVIHDESTGEYYVENVIFLITTNWRTNVAEVTNIDIGSLSSGRLKMYKIA